MKQRVSIVIPARNEAQSLRALLPELRELYPGVAVTVVDDGSTDDTAEVARQAGAAVVALPHGMGNGAAVKAGIRAVETEIIVLMDGDGQHSARDVGALVETLEQDFDMAVGARDWRSQANVGRAVANAVYGALARWMVGHRIPDLTSGFRAVRRDKLAQILYLLPNGFSYPTTVTMAFFRAGYRVAYLPIRTAKRTGSSHISSLSDGARFFLIIFKVGTLYSPLKLFLPVSLLFMATGVGYYLYTFAVYHRFTNMSALLIISSIVVFLIGLVSEQITSLLYSRIEK